MTMFDDISKEVGWTKRKIVYPSVSEVREALDRHGRHDIFQLILWHRNLEHAQTPKEKKILNLIDNGLENMKI